MDLAEYFESAKGTGVLATSSASGEVDAALVYRTDARLARQARILYEIPGSLHVPVSYPMALTRAGRSNPAAQTFFHFLQSKEARQILARHGFLTTSTGP